MKILYVEGNEQRRAHETARVARARKDVTLHGAPDYRAAVAVFEDQGQFDMIISGLIYPGRYGEQRNGAMDFYQYLCGNSDVPRVPFALLFDPLEGEKSDTASELLIQTWVNGLCLDMSGVFCMPQSSIIDAIRGMELPARTPGGMRVRGDPLAALRKPEPPR